MTLVRLNATRTGLEGLPQLEAALQALPSTARITVMIHGYKYAPGRAGHCPHDYILSAKPEDLSERAISWPSNLGVGNAHLGIAFGWDGSGSLWRAWKRSAEAGCLLAQGLDLVADRGCRVDMIAHSLGARVAISALSRVRSGAVGTMILLAPAEFQVRACAALFSPAGRTAQVLNVVSRQNRVFDRGLEWLIAPHRWGERSLGMGLESPHANWADLAIDDPAVLPALGVLGYPVAAPKGRVCHWSGYVRAGLFPLYRDVLDQTLPFAVLKSHLLLAARGADDRAQRRGPLPFGRQVSF